MRLKKSRSPKQCSWTVNKQTVNKQTVNKQIVFVLGAMMFCLWFSACAPPGALQQYQPTHEELTQGLDISTDSLRALERESLTTAEMQMFYVNGVWYQRFLADSAFKAVTEYDYDNLRDFPIKTVFDVVLVAPDSTRYALAKTVAGALEPTGYSGYYRGFLSREKLRMLILNGVSAYATAPFMHRRTFDRRDTQ